MWSRQAPLPPPRWFWDEIDAFAQAARLVAAGEIETARERFAALRQDEARAWFVEHAQVSGGKRVLALGRGRPASVIAGARSPTPAQLRHRVWERDNYRCRYCGLPTIHEGVRVALQAAVGRDVIPWGDTNAARHGVAFVARAEYDHVHPLSLGGANDEANLVTACPGCNYGKDRYTVEELGLDDPRSRPPSQTPWDGLTSLIPALRRAARAASS